MNVPDKIYVSCYFSEDESPHGLWYLDKSEHDINVEYIRKDTLLEWAKEKKKQLLEQESENDEPSDVAAGINAGLGMLIGKLKSM